MLISLIGLLEPIQNQDHRIIPGYFRNPYRFIHTKCPLSQPSWDTWSHRTAVLRRILDWFVVDFSCLHLAGDFDGLRDIAGLYCSAKF